MAADPATYDPAGTSSGARAVPEPPTANTKRLYQAEPVDRYIAAVHAEIDELRRQLGEALHIVEAAGDRAAAADEAQARLGRTLLSTQRAADAAVGDAEKRARGIVAAASQDADAMLAEVHAQAQDVINEAHVAVEVLIEAMRRPAPGGVAPGIDLTEDVPGLILTLRTPDSGDAAAHRPAPRLTALQQRGQRPEEKMPADHGHETGWQPRAPARPAGQRLAVAGPSDPPDGKQSQHQQGQDAVERRAGKCREERAAGAGDARPGAPVSQASTTSRPWSP